jgi:hypothetical protein
MRIIHQSGKGTESFKQNFLLVSRPNLLGAHCSGFDITLRCDVYSGTVEPSPPLAGVCISAALSHVWSRESVLCVRFSFLKILFGTLRSDFHSDCYRMFWSLVGANLSLTGSYFST